MLSPMIIHPLHQQQEETVKLNPLRLPAPENSIVKITSKGGGGTNNTTASFSGQQQHQQHVFAKATSFDKDLKNYGISMECDMAKVFGFQTNGEVVVEVVEDLTQCEIQMLEVSGMFLLC